jgi:hypothetical protein
MTALIGSAATASASAVLPSISGVSFTGTAGSGVASPTVTITGAHFGSAPAGTSDATTTCGGYSANGDVYNTRLYFVDDNDFIAGYGTPTAASCIGVTVESWTSKKIVLAFGNAYGTFAHWYLSNGDGFAISVKGAIFGGDVSGLS